MLCVQAAFRGVAQRWHPDHVDESQKAAAAVRFREAVEVRLPFAQAIAMFVQLALYRPDGTQGAKRFTRP